MAGDGAMKADEDAQRGVGPKLRDATQSPLPEDANEFREEMCHGGRSSSTVHHARSLLLSHQLPPGFISIRGTKGKLIEP